MTTFDQIIDHFGSKAELARRLNQKPQALTRWQATGFPAKAAIKIERITNGHFKAIDMPISGEAQSEQLSA